MADCRIYYLPVAWGNPPVSFDRSEVTPVSPYPLGRPVTADTTRGGFNPMPAGAWLALRPHQPELFDSDELRIEPPALAGTHGYSSMESLRRHRSWAGGCAQARRRASGARFKARRSSGAADSWWTDVRGGQARWKLKNDENCVRVSKLGTCQNREFFKIEQSLEVECKLAPQPTAS
jgi:hypothetical protein